MIKHKVASGLILMYMQYMKYYGWTSYWNVIYYIDIASRRNFGIRNHELTHIEQMKRDGKFLFTIKYLWYAYKYGYKLNPYEVEAFKNQYKE